ncbi:MAG: hypothetical protein M1825_006154 [Sarcosagium campestre]|nr:MAG: hypothetical protein M1825_006154 [Sarcosagium campestre]
MVVALRHRLNKRPSFNFNLVNLPSLKLLQRTTANRKFGIKVLLPAENKPNQSIPTSEKRSNKATRAMSSSQDAQPTLEQVYTTAGNPADQTPAETQAASSGGAQGANDTTVFRRQAHDNVGAEPTPTSLARGTRRDPQPANGQRDDTPQDELDGEQMRAPGEGDVMRAQFRKTGQGEEKGLLSDLDRKKAEQAEARERVKADRQHGIDVDGAAGQSAGPAAVEGR